MTTGLLALFTVGAASLVIWKACDYFEAGSNFVGRNMSLGVRGATINAIGSSLPELLTTFCLLFLFRDQDGFSAGIATCAGSAVFNAVIIPAVVILAVTLKGVAPFVTLSKVAVIRDAAFFIAAELVLIYFLGGHVLTWWMGAALLVIYAMYFGFMMWQVRGASREDDDDEDEEEMTSTKAWMLLGVSTAVIGVACYGLSWAVIALATWWKVPAFMTAVVFGAAATSVPDTVISLKDALNREYDDAVSNAIGSNIFDITVCLGFPLLCYGLVYGNVVVASTETGAASVQVLRIGLVVITTLVTLVFLIARKLGRSSGLALFGLFAGWMLFLAAGLPAFS